LLVNAKTNCRSSDFKWIKHNKRKRCC
jgi:hypothetical protein